MNIPITLWYLPYSFIDTFMGPQKKKQSVGLSNENEVNSWDFYLFSRRLGIIIIIIMNEILFLSNLINMSLRDYMLLNDN